MALEAKLELLEKHLRYAVCVTRSRHMEYKEMPCHMYTDYSCYSQREERELKFEREREVMVSI